MREAVAATRALLAEAADAAVVPALSDRDMLAFTAATEDAGRALDAVRVIAAGELAHRSRTILGSESLAKRMGFQTAAELMEQMIRISTPAARARLRLGSQTRPAITMTGDELPAEFDAVRAGLATGRLGIDSAQVITRVLSAAKAGAPTDTYSRFVPAEHELVCSAIGAAAEAGVPALPPVTPSCTRDEAQVWAEFLNPDGAEPTEKQFASRGFWFKPAPNGMIPFSGLAVPELAASMQAVFTAMTNPRQSERFMPEHELAALEQQRAEQEQQSGLEPAQRKDPRSRSQRMHDALITVFDIAGRSGELPTLGGASPTMVVTVSAEDHGSGHGVGHVDGLEVPISMAAVRQACCANGIQAVDLAANGRVLALGTTERCFNRAQRRALDARDGGCVICARPAVETEAHHVVPWSVERRTHVDNGVLLCWFHHRTIETRGGWRVRMVDGSPEIMPPPELGPPEWRPARRGRVRQAHALRQRMHDQR
ncbi:hypothetical protein ASC59_07585 [Leifsonia sp. Root1293]|nr:hypothetical protein ASC59_07585 [Leifsonia sp. Root1293]KRA11876.1 hypothetical protein ASD61_07585 [Leifsonia sp. Root60]